MKLLVYSFIELVFLICVVPPASAYSIMSSFSDGCHEGITLTAYMQTRNVAFKDGFLTAPPKGVWEEAAKTLFAELEVNNAQIPQRAERFNYCPKQNQ